MRVLIRHAALHRSCGGTGGGARWYRSVTMRSAFRRARRRRTRTHRVSSPVSDHPHPDSSASGTHAASRVGEGPA